ncbi:MAG TPA: sensor domain-containing diguanylate cyclase [Malonomonas sp.]
MKNWISRFVNQAIPQQLSNKDEQSFADLPLASALIGPTAVPNRQSIVTQLQDDCQRQLNQLRLGLKLKTAALLWIGPASDQLGLYACSSHTDRINSGPYQLGVGVTGALKECSELLLAPVRESSPAIPYYRSNKGVGSFMALRLFVPSNDVALVDGFGILCVDRESSECWTIEERHQVELCSELLMSSVSRARQWFICDRDRHAYLRAFHGVRKLNASLGLQSAFAAAAEAIRSVVPADFLAINLVDEEQHRVTYVEGEKAELLANKSFPLGQGVVGQVLKYARTLPENADYHGTSPVFSEAHLFADYRSLMIVPLCQEDGQANGALTVAARQSGVFSRSCREMLELIATQIAIKIDLANSHEQINQLATVDALTGIANRRAYQRGFEAMLDRARRRSGSLYLILCDIDHFKKINDSFGHPVGDEVLRQVSKLFDRVVRAVDLAARTGGEEFAILLEDADEDGAWKVAERLRRLVEGMELIVQGKRVAVSISLGISAFPRDANSIEKLVSCADQALYHAKGAGRNRSVLWNEIS